MFSYKLAAVYLLLGAGLSLGTPLAPAQELQNPFSLNEELPSKSFTESTSDNEELKAEELKEPNAASEATATQDEEIRDEITVPRLTSPVVDLGGILSPGENARLADKIRDILKQNGPQIQILIVKDLGGFPIEEYSIKVAESWKIGSKAKGDGVIILMSQADREVRIEVGEGIEGELTDVEAHQIIQYGMIPEFRKGNFGKGFETAIDTIAGEFGIQAYSKSASSRNLSPPKRLAKIRRSKEQMVSLLLPIIIFFATFPLIIKILGRNPLLRSVAGAAYMGALTFFLVGHLFFIILAVVFGFFIGLIGPLNFLMVMLSSSGRGGYGRGGSYGGSGGWSGGGGGFSGGGASGSW